MIVSFPYGKNKIRFHLYTKLPNELRVYKNLNVKCQKEKYLEENKSKYCCDLWVEKISKKEPERKHRP